MQSRRYQHLPDAQEREDEGDDYPDTREPGEEYENRREDKCADKLLAKAVVVDHVDEDGIVVTVALDQDPCDVARLEDLVVRKRS